MTQAHRVLHIATERARAQNTARAAQQAREAADKARRNAESDRYTAAHREVCEHCGYRNKEGAEVCDQRHCGRTLREAV